MVFAFVFEALPAFFLHCFELFDLFWIQHGFDFSVGLRVQCLHLRPNGLHFRFFGLQNGLYLSLLFIG